MIAIVIFIGFILLISLYIKLKRKKRYDVAKITLKDIDLMSGHDFEDYLHVLFASLDYETFVTKKSRDYGADMLYIDKVDRKVIVQAKRYQAKLGLSSVQEIHAAKFFYQAEDALIITSAEDVTDSCWKLAASTDVAFLMREEIERIIKYMKQGNLEKARAIIEQPLRPDPNDKFEVLLEPVHQTRGRIEAGEYFIKK